MRISRDMVMWCIDQNGSDVTSRQLLGHVILRAIHDQATIDEFHKNGYLDFDLTINGRPADFEEVIHILSDAFDASVKEEAHKLFQEKLNPLSDSVQEIVDLLDAVRGKARAILGLEKEEW